jgi:hypothetical protein
VSPSRLTGRALYALYSARFAHRHPLSWDVMHAHERRTWSSLSADVLAADMLDPQEISDTRRWLDSLKHDSPTDITSAEIVRSIQEGRDERDAQIRRALDCTPEDEAKEGDALSSMVRTRIPPDVVELLRAGLYTNLARACEDAPVTMPEAHTHAGWADVRVRIEGASRALDALGWDTSTQDTKVELDAAMIAALEAEIDTWEWLAEQDRLETAEGRRRAATKATTIKRFLASVTPPEIVSRADAETTDGDA